MQIRVEYNGRIIHEIGSDEIKDEIIIGRSQSCTWQIPRDDQMCSSRHARLSVKGRQLWLHDLESTNGTFHNGRRIAKKRLVAGDKIGIGNSVLSVEVKRGGGGRQISALRVLTGKERGQSKQLTPPLFVVGSDPGSNLAFLDMLVSRRHAEISIKEDGSCWIRDLQSKNGTTVNGLPLRDDKERLLKDGDRVSFSHFEVEFQDGAVARSNKQVWLRIAILAATFAVGLGVYYGWQRVRPAAESYIRQAQRHASQENFVEASEVLEKAATARHAASNQVTIENLRRQIGEWQNTLEVWQRAQRSLTAGRWVPASRDLGLLQASRKDAWEWNVKAIEERDNMQAAKALLDATLRGESLCGREEAGFLELEENLGLLKEALKQAPAESEVLGQLLESAHKVVARLGGIVAESQAVEQALEQLVLPEPEYEKIVAAVAERSSSNEPAVRRRATVIAPALQALAASATEFARAREQLRALEIKEALASEVQLPPADLSAIDPRISAARQGLDRGVREFRQQGMQLQMLLSEVDKYGAVGGSNHPLPSFIEGDQLEQALACDTLERPLPKRSRGEPAGAFDALLGVDEFYAWLDAYPEQADPALFGDLPFVAALTRLRELSARIETLLNFVGQPAQQWLRGGSIDQRVAELEGVQQQCSALVKSLIERAEGGSSRSALIAGGIVARLTLKGGDNQIRGVAPQQWVADELKRQRVELLKINNEYLLAAPARQIEIRGEILEKGIPGDPIVRRMWAFRDAAAAAMR